MNVHSLSNTTAKTVCPACVNRCGWCSETLASRTPRSAEGFGTRRSPTPQNYSKDLATPVRTLSPTLLAPCVKQPERVALPGQSQQTDLASVVPRIERSRQPHSKRTWHTA